MAVVNELNTTVRLFDINELSLLEIRELTLNLGVAPATKLMKPDKLEQLWEKEKALVIQQRAHKSEENSSVLIQEQHDLIEESHEPQIETQDAELVERKPLTRKEKKRIQRLHNIELETDGMIKHFQKKDLESNQKLPPKVAETPRDPNDYISDL